MIELLTEVVLPRAERLIPEAIGPKTIVAFFGAGGALGLVVASALGKPPAIRDDWVRRGALAGFWVGILLYTAALLNHLT